MSNDSKQFVSRQEFEKLQEQLGAIQFDETIFIPEQDRGKECSIHLIEISDENFNKGIIVFEKMKVDQYINNANRQVIELTIIDPATEEVSKRLMEYTDFARLIEKVNVSKSVSPMKIAKSQLEKLKLTETDLTFGYKNFETITRNIQTGKKNIKVSKVPNVIDLFWDVEYNDKQFSIHYFAIN